MEPNAVSQQEQERWESCLSKALKTWVRGNHHQKQRLHEVREILYRVVTKFNDDETLRLSLVGELLLDQISYAFYGPLTPIEKAKLVYQTIPWHPSKPNTGMVNPPDPPAEPQGVEPTGNDPLNTEKAEAYLYEIQTADLQFELARKAKEDGLIEEAIKKFRQAAEIYCRYQHAGMAACLHMIGKCQQDKGDYNAALLSFNEALMLSRKNNPKAAIHCDLAHLFKSQGQLREAQAHAEACLKLDPNLFPEMKTFLEKIQAEIAMKPKSAEQK